MNHLKFFLFLFNYIVNILYKNILCNQKVVTQSKDVDTEKCSQYVLIFKTSHKLINRT